MVIISRYACFKCHLYTVTRSKRIGEVSCVYLVNAKGDGEPTVSTNVVQLEELDWL